MQIFTIPVPTIGSTDAAPGKVISASKNMMVASTQRLDGFQHPQGERWEALHYRHRSSTTMHQTKQKQMRSAALKYQQPPPSRCFTGGITVASYRKWQRFANTIASSRRELGVSADERP
jgi:hypothetical protein